jgi:hypothetical protein
MEEGTSRKPPSKCRIEEELWRKYLAKNMTWRVEMAILKFPGGYCWGYTKWVYQRRSPKPASQGGPSRVVWRIAYRAAQLLEIPQRYWTQALMADPKTGPWRVAL